MQRDDRWFSGQAIEGVCAGDHVAAFAGIQRAAERVLDRLETAVSLRDLMTPGLRLEKLKGDREGRFSVRINDQWRICFLWPDGKDGPHDVEIVDYH